MEDQESTLHVQGNSAEERKLRQKQRQRNEVERGSEWISCIHGCLIPKGTVKIAILNMVYLTMNALR